jgi:hypothetical protein
MALSAADLRVAWRYALSLDATIGQSFTKPQLDAAATATDAWIDTNQGATTSGPGYNSALPASPGFRAASTQQKSILFAAVSFTRTGVVG